MLCSDITWIDVMVQGYNQSGPSTVGAFSALPCRSLGGLANNFEVGQMQSIIVDLVLHPPPTFDGLLCSKLIVEREGERESVVLRLRNPKSIAS